MHISNFNSALVEKTETGFIAYYFDSCMGLFNKPIGVTTKRAARGNHFPTVVENILVKKLYLKTGSSTKQKANDEKNKKTWVTELCAYCERIFFTSIDDSNSVKNMALSYTGLQKPDLVYVEMFLPSAYPIPHAGEYDIKNKIHAGLAKCEYLQRKYKSSDQGLALNMVKRDDPLVDNTKLFTQLGERVLVYNRTEEGEILGAIIHENGKITPAIYTKDGMFVQRAGEPLILGADLATGNNTNKQTKYIVLYINDHDEIITSRLFPTEKVAQNAAKKHKRVLMVGSFTFDNPFLKQ